MKLAVARMLDSQVRFFAGRYEAAAARVGGFTPVTTGQPDLAHCYDDSVVAQLVADLFNAIDGFQTGERRKPWVIIPLPEAWI